MSLFYLEPDTWRLPQSGVSIYDVTDSSAVVTWRTIVDLPSGIQQYYKYSIEYRQEGESEWTVFRTVDHQPDSNDTQRHVLSDLLYDTWYEVTGQVCEDGERTNRGDRRNIVSISHHYMWR